MEYCNFCGRSEKEVGPMYYGLKGCICKECADLLYDESVSNVWARRSLSWRIISIGVRPVAAFILR